jgi:hypothetical protein
MHYFYYLKLKNYLQYIALIHYKLSLVFKIPSNSGIFISFFWAFFNALPDRVHVRKNSRNKECYWQYENACKRNKVEQTLMTSVKCDIFSCNEGVSARLVQKSPLWLKTNTKLPKETKKSSLSPADARVYWWRK